MDFQDYVKFLDWSLKPFYQTENAVGGHDWLHVRDVERMGPKIRSYLEFDMNEFTIAAKLHNIDRSKKMKPVCDSRGGEETLLRRLLINAPFSSDARDRIVFAVLQHGEKSLREDAPSLAVALQDADKLVRFRPSNLLAEGAYGGYAGIPAFLPKNPFGFTSTREEGRLSMWLGFMGNLEWIGMLSCDAARELIDPGYLAYFMSYLRLLGREMAEYAGCLSRAEDDIRKALGSYCNWVEKRIRGRAIS